MAGCKSTANTQAAQEPTEQTATPIETDREALSVSIEEQVILDQQGVKITALSLFKNSDGTAMNIQIENLGRNEVTVTLWHARVNGKKALESGGINCVGAAGKKATAEISLYAHDVITVREIELGFRIHDSVAMKDMKSEVITIKTSKTESATQVEEAGDLTALNENAVIFYKDGVKVVVGPYLTDGLDTNQLEVLIANDSDTEVNVYLRDFFMNGMKVESAWLQFTHIRAGNSQ